MDNKPLAGCGIQLTAKKNGSTLRYTVITGEDGYARFENIPYGTYTLSEISAH